MENKRIVWGEEIAKKPINTESEEDPRRKIAWEMFKLFASFTRTVAIVEPGFESSIEEEAQRQLDSELSGYKSDVDDWYNELCDELNSSKLEDLGGILDSAVIPEPNSCSISVDDDYETAKVLELDGEELLFKLSNLLDISITELRLHLGND